MTNNSIKTVQLPFYLGCPVWNCDQWGGNVYPVGTKRSDWLNWYSRTFNTVEGNSTFYGLPKIETVTRWAEQVAKGFKFALKFPRVISHDLRLIDADSELARFIDTLKPLAQADVLGPSFLQLPPDFAPKQFGDLEKFLHGLPKEYPWAVEVRHKEWFDSSDSEQRLDDLLRELKIDKVLFDSRPLYSLPPEDEHEKVSQTRKPKTPHRTTVTALHPFVRIVGRDKPEQVEQALKEWSTTITNWINQGLKPIVFTHAPDDAFAPALARMLFEQIRSALPELPPLPRPPQVAEQKTLFEL